MTVYLLLRDDKETILGFATLEQAKEAKKKLLQKAEKSGEYPDNLRVKTVKVKAGVEYAPQG